MRDDGDDKKPTMTYRMHEVIASVMCKLLEASAYSHLREKMESEDIMKSIGEWKIGDKATSKIVEWCQDQWRRKELILPNESSRYGTGDPLCVPLFGVNMPLCHVCGSPCPDCRENLGEDLPLELVSARELLGCNVSQEVQESQNAQAVDTRKLRSRKRKAN